MDPALPHHLPHKNRVKTSIYLLPNLITAASLFFGFMAIKYSIDARITGHTEYFVYAAYLIMVAGLCDMLDGNVARLTHTQSAFGIQFDTLSDMISFGLTPAIVAYNYCLSESFLGFYVAFVYAACAALRLARFNVQSALGKASGNFTGIPTTVAAMPVAVFILMIDKLLNWQSSTKIVGWVQNLLVFLVNPEVKIITLLVIVFLLSLGMISTFEYWSSKSFALPKKRPFRFFSALIILGALLFNLEFVFTLALLLLIYCLHGPVLWIFTRKDKAHEEDEIFQSDDGDDE